MCLALSRYCSSNSTVLSCPDSRLKWGKEYVVARWAFGAITGCITGNYRVNEVFWWIQLEGLASHAENVGNTDTCRAGDVKTYWMGDLTV